MNWTWSGFLLSIWRGHCVLLTMCIVHIDLFQTCSVYHCCTGCPIWLIPAKKFQKDFWFRQSWGCHWPFPFSTLLGRLSKKIKGPFRYALRKKLRDYLGIFPIGGGRVFPIPKTFVNWPSVFLHAKFRSFRGGKSEFWEFGKCVGGGSPIPKSKCNKNGKILTFWWKPKMFLRV